MSSFSTVISGQTEYPGREPKIGDKLKAKPFADKGPQIGIIYDNYTNESKVEFKNGEDEIGGRKRSFLWNQLSWMEKEKHWSVMPWGADQRVASPKIRTVRVALKSLHDKKLIRLNWNVGADAPMLLQYDELFLLDRVVTYDLWLYRPYTAVDIGNCKYE